MKSSGMRFAKNRDGTSVRPLWRTLSPTGLEQKEEESG